MNCTEVRERLLSNAAIGHFYRLVCKRRLADKTMVYHQDSADIIWKKYTMGLNQKKPLALTFKGYHGEPYDSLLRENGIVVSAGGHGNPYWYSIVGFTLEKVGKFVQPQFHYRFNEPRSEPMELAITEWVNLYSGNLVIERCLAYKEDLMAAAWAPERVLRWLEAGIEVEDM